MSLCRCCALGSTGTQHRGQCSKRPKKGGRLEALHAERMRLYRQAADFTVTVPIEQPASEIAAEILHKIRGQLKTDLRGLAKSEKKG